MSSYFRSVDVGLLTATAAATDCNEAETSSVVLVRRLFVILVLIYPTPEMTT